VLVRECQRALLCNKQSAFCVGSKKRRYQALAITNCHSLELPGGLHELDEVVVVVNRGADSGIVLVPLGSLDFAVAVSVAEVLEELHEHLVLGHLAILDLRVHAAVVHSPQVSGSDLARTVRVELEEGLVDHSLSPRVKRTADANEELVEVDVTITVGIEEAHELVGLVSRDFNLDLAKATVELFSIDLVVAVERVEVPESSAETSDRLGTTSMNLLSHSLED
jgi:hypothetical protein